MNNKTTINKAIVDLGYSPDVLAQRQAELLAYIRQTVPEVIADNQIDVEKLKELLGHDRIAPDEHYELNWAGKSAARREIQKTSSLTLRPDANNPPNAQHMLIEGENLEVLRVLQKSYYGKAKMIYIDPPYNTGNDSFVYPDDYSETLEEYQRRTGEKNDAGYLNKQSLWKKNTKENGQYHSAWLSMMYPRLYLARNLLRDDGVIFVSIDENELNNLYLLMAEIFGEECHVSTLTVVNNFKGRNDRANIATCHEYLLIFAKSNFSSKGLPLSEEQLSEFRYVDDRGERYALRDLRKRGRPDRREDRPNMFFPIFFNPVTRECSLQRESVDQIEITPKRGDGTDGRWRWGKERVADNLKLLEPRFSSKKERWDIDHRVYLNLVEATSDDEESDEDDRIFERTSKPKSFWWGSELSTDVANREFKKLVQNLNPDYPKSPFFIEKLLRMSTDNDDLVIDFFAGYGTTAQAVMELNVECGSNRKCISVQIPELLDLDSEGYKAGYRTIADITRARIEAVMTKLKGEHPDKTQELTCAYFMLAPSNFKVWRVDVNDENALLEQLSMFKSAEKAGKSQVVDAQVAMLTELLLKYGLGALGVHAISKPRQVAGVTVHRVLTADDKTMWLCFETYTDALKDEIVKAMPAQVVMLNSCFVGPKADEQLANLQLELAGLDIGLTVI